MKEKHVTRWRRDRTRPLWLYGQTILWFTLPLVTGYLGLAMWLQSSADGALVHEGRSIVTVIGIRAVLAGLLGAIPMTVFYWIVMELAYRRATRA